MAAELKNQNAMRKLGNFFLEIKDYDDMKKWYSESIKCGNFKAMELLRKYYLDVEKNSLEASQCLSLYKEVKEKLNSQSNL